MREGAAFSTRHENVQIQFTAGLARRVELEGRPAYRLPFPAALLRFQRREFYRVETPRDNRRNAAWPCQSRNCWKPTWSMSVSAASGSPTRRAKRTSFWAR
ncbi:MAG: flagellar regulator YcgR PilZN domain-containing protein [Pseudomonadota bacterium]